MSGHQLSPAEIDALPGRWSSCWAPDQVAHHLAGVATPWCVAAGWALDLFRGRQTRSHGDIEIAIPAAGFPGIRSRFAGYSFDTVDSGRIWEDATPGQRATLADLLARVHPGHRWLAYLSEGGGDVRPA
ncbi:nucleotidyltransferase domain-containing protein [Symbioplanes lichenis]|uniref:nucleotidyltransferase domain-containing protein n=1 Tax=Symbioplanes lichenis TaxID=1629072 RepID=UPI002739A2A9|nr:hypothetical protein [Actinoplanes lichenis]